MKLPAGYNNVAISNDGNTITVYHDDHTVALPRYAIVTRKRSDFNSATKAYSVPSYRVRFFLGSTDVDGNPRAEKTLVDLDVRFPVNGASNDLASVIADLNAFIDQTPAIAEEMKKFTLPQVCCEEEE